MKRYKCFLLWYMAAALCGNKFMAYARATQNGNTETAEKSAHTLTAAGSKILTQDHPQAAGKDTAEFFSSIRTGNMTIASGTKWYYEKYDLHGRIILAVQYEKDTQLNKTQWQYNDNTPYPIEKYSETKTGTTLTRYNSYGNSIVIAVYNTKQEQVSHTENTYDDAQNLIKQTVVQGGNTETSEWIFKNNTAVSQTKYRNGKKIAYIEIGTPNRIVHLYVNGKEIFTTEEE